MEIFFRLLFGHFLADFTFQTNFIAKWKRLKLGWLWIHVLIHPACYVVMTWPFINDEWVKIGGLALNGWLCIPLVAILHFLEDWFRVTMVNRGWPDNTLFFAWDQIIHILVLWFVSPTGTQPLTSSWPLIGSLFVIVTHFATVTVWFIEKDIYGRDYPQTEEKYLSILQRLVVWLTFFLPTPWWYVVLVFVLISFGRHVWARHVDFTWTSVSLGNLLAIGCGLISRFSLGFHL